jgi:hypothetical protein
VQEFSADPQYRWQRIVPGLEDVFIDLMHNAANGAGA